jgi:formiminoglutamate deiminase
MATPITTLHAHHALLPGGWAEGVEVDIAADGTIAAVRTGAPAADGPARILLPALANLHSHAFQRAMAGMAERRGDGPNSFWGWRTLMYRFLAHLAPEHIEAIAALAFVEMQEAGYASVAEFHYVHHQPGGAPYDRLAETSERIFAAADDTGIGLTHLPVLYSHGGAGAEPLTSEQRRFGNDLDRFSRLVETAWAAAMRSLPADARVGVAAHSLRATTPEQLAALARLFGDGPIHIHAAEQPQEVADIEAWLGARPVEWLLDNLEIGAGWCVVHATHMTADETRGLARSGAVAGLCPVTEANLGDGAFDGPPFLAAGGAFGIGTDSNVRISISAELSTLEYSQRLRDRARNVLQTGAGSVGQSLYTGALAGGARALGRKCGTIAAGQLADLVGLDGDHVAFAPLAPDQFLDGWIFAADDRVVRDLWSAGRHCVRGGRHVARDGIEARYRAALRDLARRC